VCDKLGSVREVLTAVQDSLFDHAERRQLTGGAWIDVRAGWLDDAEQGRILFDELLEAIPWRAERRQMYDRVLDVPRLVSFHDLVGADGVDAVPHPALKQLRRRLNDIYAGELGEPFTSAGLCLYRDGNDSVAWHGDTIGRSSTEDTMVAILSLGCARTFALRPRGGGTSLRIQHGHGDLLVMGGSCQRTWEHAIPKTSKPIGPRISIQFRPRDVR
jgi:alkylated DNA repair dioxygenase AlkB